MIEMQKAWLLVDGDYAIGAIFDEQMAQDIADVYDWQIEEIEFVDGDVVQ